MITYYHPFADILTTRFKVRPIRNLLDSGRQHRLLDIGCGSGFMLSQLENNFEASYGIDLARAALNFGQKFTRALLVEANAEKLPFRSASFDCVIATDVFEHIPKDIIAMKEVQRVLRTKGIILVYVPSLHGLLSHLPTAHLYHNSKTSYMLDQRYYTRNSLIELVERAGLTVEYVGYHNVFAQEFFTQLLKLTSRILGKRYEHQANITQFTKSFWFPLYKYFLLPIMTLIIRTEEIIAKNLLGAQVPGHRIVIKARKAGNKYGINR